ncbi:ATP-binding protein [soil metagenome]
MSYRTFKHLLGETSLERKCRFIFGSGIFALVAVSFSIYGLKTESLVIGESEQAARMQVGGVLKELHFKSYVRPELAPVVDRMSRELSPQDGFQSFDSHVIKPRAKDPDRGPRDDFERLVLERFLKAAARQEPDAPHHPFSFADGTPAEYSEIGPGRREFTYVQAIRFKQGCFASECHKLDYNHFMHRDDEGKWGQTRAGDLAGVVVVKLPMEQTNKAINHNRAILIATALFTAILAMFASWTIVRYVIVRPVKHLRDVSNIIASGKLTIRSQIQTGDEFEELSHAFNRMLHNLVSMQQELREVNGDLDRKVDELAQANMALYEMNRLKSDFLATMSHELRTPLNSIIGFSEVLSGNDQLNEKQRRYAQNIQTSGKMLLGMINDILDLAKIESGKMEVRVEDFSIRDICEALAGQMRPLAERKNIDLECRLDEAIPLLRQDPVKLRQIIYNLLSNAIKFTPEGGRVTLTARPEGRNVIVSVADTGIGIAEEDREKIFEKFRQAGIPGHSGDVLTREHQGTGLGLSIVRELAKLLGGDVRLESEPGLGSTFTVNVPQQMTGDRRFDVNLSDERIDLSKARRVEPRSPVPLVSGSGLATEPIRGRIALRVDPGRSNP